MMACSQPSLSPNDNNNTRAIPAQRGHAEAALPLYQRALSIMERTLGADHLETANVLTDIAVIHLEKAGSGAGVGWRGKLLMARTLACLALANGSHACPHQPPRPIKHPTAG